MPAYYNEHDPYAAQWLRNLIEAGHIAPGIVDERSIEDVIPSDLRGFTQCHFFAGIGVWSYALRLAGWPDDRPVWTGSCPCQPFSSAGKGARFDDERHLWPAFHHLIQECHPPVVFGEQVASKDADPWIDLVQDDLEALGYAVGAVPFPSAGVGAPHIRDRLYWVAHSECQRVRARGRGQDAGASGSLQKAHGERQWVWSDVGERSAVCGMADPDGHGRSAMPRNEVHDTEYHAEPRGGAGLLGNAGNEGLPERIGFRGIPGGPLGADAGKAAERAGIHAVAGPGPTNGLWRDADWLLCRDGRWRPVEPGTFPLVNGAPNRVGRLRAYGNAINAEAARVFIESFAESLT